MKLLNPIKIGDTDITEVDISKEKFTANVIIQSEKEFLVTGGVFPSGAMEDSRDYLIHVAAKMLHYRADDLKDKLSGEDLINITNMIKGFFGGSVLNNLIQTLLEKPQL